jgi:hypothetical protein
MHTQARLTYTTVVAAAACLVLAVMDLPASGQLAVIGGGGPLFPWKVDTVKLVIKFERSGKRVDSLVAPLDTALYESLKRNIDSTIHYVDAVRRKRPEICGAPKGPKFDAVLHCIKGNKRVVQVSFCRRQMGSGLLDVKSERYPYVVTFKPDFAHTLDSLAVGLRKRVERK